MKRNILYIISILVLYSCQPDLDYKISGYTQKIIVEGYINTGEYPVVYLSLNVPFSEKVDSISILNNIIRTAKVTVSDGVNEEILTSGFWDTKHFPPHEYHGTSLIGEEGKTYYLTVEYGGYTMHSQTTIPHKIQSVNFSTTPISGNDTLRILSMKFNINSAMKNSYRVFTKKRKDGFFQRIPLLYNANLSLQGENIFTISPSPSKNDSSFSEGSYFSVGDTIDIKICAIDSISTQFFKDLSKFSSATGIGSDDIFIGEKNALKSNITSPGFGIWCGNGAKNFTYIVQ